MNNLDKLKSIAEKSGREFFGSYEYEGCLGLYESEDLAKKNAWSTDKENCFKLTDPSTTESLRSAFRIAIKVIEVLSAANEWYGVTIDHGKFEIVDVVKGKREFLSDLSGLGDVARQAKLEADEILKGVAE